MTSRYEVLVAIRSRYQQHAAGLGGYPKLQLSESRLSSIVLAGSNIGGKRPKRGTTSRNEVLAVV
jgi:hypothetical protein